MRQIVLDTETTGLNAKAGDRIIEIGCVELVNRRLTGRHLHHYLNPERSSDPEALKVHGLTDDFLADKPKFAEVADDIQRFCEEAEIIIHNAAFDVGFLDEEFQRIGRTRFAEWVAEITDTLAISKKLNPGKRHNLDALCERYGVNNAHRTLHGALLDAQLLAEVYLAMTRGQDSLMMDLDGARGAEAQSIDVTRLNLVVLSPTPDELAAHERYLDHLEKEIKRPALWRELGSL